MVTVSQAEGLVMERLGRLPAEKCRLKDTPGRVLRQEVRADRDGPPFDRATLDGVCLRFSEWAAGRRVFTVAGIQAAGGESVAAPPEGACLEIMTGAPVPEPCDCVLPVEEFERAGEVVRARPEARLEKGLGLHRQGSDFRSGDVLLAPGRRITGRELAIAASCGCMELQVTVAPRIAVLTTGDELVEVEDEPKRHQIRRSNDLALRAAFFASGFDRVELNHLPDSAQAISWNLERLLQQADVIVVTGGASKGRFDHVPATLEELGVCEHFHGVAQRPGRPLWFGTFERAGDFLHPEDTRVVAVFALPGNPVSAFTCAHRYVLPALAVMAGLPPPRRRHAILAAPVRAHPGLALLMPASLVPDEDGRRLVQPRPCNTSGDFAALAGTDGFIELPPATSPTHPAGTAGAWYEWR